jgi:hypothetical protein
MMMKLNPIVSKSKSKLYRPQNIKKFTLDLQLQTIQILTSDVQMLSLCLSFFITPLTHLSNDFNIEDNQTNCWYDKSNNKSNPGSVDKFV